MSYRRILALLLACTMLCSCAPKNSVQSESMETEAVAVEEADMGLSFAVYDRDDQPDNIIIHSIHTETASASVQYTVDYTAQEGSKLRLSGDRLYYESDFTTTGQRDKFVFALSEADFQDVGELCVSFAGDKHELYRAVIPANGAQTPAGPLQTGRENIPTLRDITVIQPAQTASAVSLDVQVQIDDHDEDPDNILIHSFAALEMPSGVVRCVLDYTAPKGMNLKVFGNKLQFSSAFSATGEKDRFVFEIDGDDIRKMRNISVEFGPYSTSLLTAIFSINWPNQSVGAGVELPLLTNGNEIGEAVNLSYEASDGITVHRFDRQWLDNQCFRYTLEVSAPEGLTMQITGPEGQQYHHATDITDGSVTAVFDLPWEIASLNSKIQVDFQDHTGAIQHSISAINGLLVTCETEISEERNVNYTLEYNWDDNISAPHSVAVHSCTAQDLTNDYVRYSVAFTAPESMAVELISYHMVNNWVVSDRFQMATNPITTGTVQTVVFDLKKDSLDSAYPVLCFGVNNKEYISIFDPMVLQLSDGKPAAEEIEPGFQTNSFRSKNDVEIFKLTAQTLDNKQVRYTVTYSAPEGIYINGSCDYVGGSESHYGIASGEDIQTFAFDVTFEHLQDNMPPTVMFADEDKAFFVASWPLDFAKMGIPTKGQEIVALTVVEYPESFGEAGAWLKKLVEEIETAIRGLFTPDAPTANAVSGVDTSMVQPLAVIRDVRPVSAQSGITPYAEYYADPFPAGADIVSNSGLAYTLTFADSTIFPENMPASYDPEALLEWGKYPGLHMNVLHMLGYTGKGSVIAYVDQPAEEHEEYAGENFHFSNTADVNSSMHGPAVLSLLAGKGIGTAPEAEVWFYGQPSWEADQTIHAQSLYQIIEQNKSLPEGEKITMVGFSDVIDPGEKNSQALEEAVKACEEAGIMVWFCDEYASAAYLPLSDKDNPENVIRDQCDNGPPKLVYVPAGSRTTASTNWGSYIYWSSGGLSWTMPYVLGIYAIVAEIDPSLTQDDLRKMIVDTAYQNDGMRIINPVEFVAAALDGVGRTEDANELRIAAEANRKYTYAVMNKAAMSDGDIAAVETYLKQISDSAVLVVDSSDINSAQELYGILQADHIRRGGKVVGVQIFGNPDLVPAFEVGYKVQMQDTVDDAGIMLTDLFYGNFNNAPIDIGPSYNVMDHFAEGWQVQLTPDWKVVRLPLAKGEFKPFFDKYMGFAEQGGLTEVPLVNFSNPIFESTQHLDDFGTFLNRMRDNWAMLDIPYTLYGNLEGQYPVATEVVGGFTAENLTAENQAGIREFIINTHGQRNNIDKCWYENGTEIRQSLMNMDTINTVLGDNPYYLDMWTCDNGLEMKNNITTVALNGNCVGMFSATHVISNNGVNCFASEDRISESNFYYFYLHYLKALNDGASRSDSFFQAQKHYANALLEDSMDGIEYSSNYQLNLCNLLSYHNFGVIEPNPAYLCIEANIIP